MEAPWGRGRGLPPCPHQGFCPGPTGGLKAAPRPPAFWAPPFNKSWIICVITHTYIRFHSQCNHLHFLPVYNICVTYPSHWCPFALTSLYTIYYSVTRHAAKTLGKENIIKTSYKDYSIRAKFRNCRRKIILLSRRILSIFTKELSSSCTSIWEI